MGLGLGLGLELGLGCDFKGDEGVSSSFMISFASRFGSGFAGNENGSSSLKVGAGKEMGVSSRLGLGRAGKETTSGTLGGSGGRNTSFIDRALVILLFSGIPKFVSNSPCEVNGSAEVSIRCELRFERGVSFSESLD